MGELLRGGQCIATLAVFQGARNPPDGGDADPRTLVDFAVGQALKQERYDLPALAHGFEFGRSA